VARDAGLKAATVILFDFDGTLYDLDSDLDPWRRSARRSLAPSERWRWRVDDILAGVDEGRRRQVLVELAACEAEALHRGGPIDGAAEVVTALHDHVAVAVVSRNLRSTLDAGLGRMGLGDLVSVAREDTIATKPDPTPFALALTRLRARTADALIVGDSSHDVDGARALGIPVVVVANRRLRVRPSGADAYVNSLAELPVLLGLPEGRSTPTLSGRSG
jgi:pyrophosphatase PpaX